MDKTYRMTYGTIVLVSLVLYFLTAYYLGAFEEERLKNNDGALKNIPIVFWLSLVALILIKKMYPIELDKVWTVIVNKIYNNWGVRLILFFYILFTLIAYLNRQDDIEKSHKLREMENELNRQINYE